MTDVQRRQKAQDVLNATPSLFGKRTATFRQAFPLVPDIRLEVIERGDGMRGAERREVYAIGSMPGEFVNCSNPLCYNGGVHIVQVIRYMEAAGLTKHEMLDSCQGNDGTARVD